MYNKENINNHIEIYHNHENYDFSLKEQNNLEEINIRDFAKLANFILDQVFLYENCTSLEINIFLIYCFYYSKTLSAGNDAKIEFSIRKITDILGCSNLVVLKAQKKFEKLGLFKIKRSKNKDGSNKINKISITIPDNLLKKFISNKDYIKQEYQHLTHEDIKKMDKPLFEIINQIGLAIPINTHLFKAVINNKKLGNITRYSYFNLYSIIHKIKTKNNRDDYIGCFNLDDLQKQLQLTRKSFYKVLKELEDSNLIIRERISKVNLQNDDNLENVKQLWYIGLVIPNNNNEYEIFNTKKNTLDNVITKLPNKLCVEKYTTPVSKNKIHNNKRIIIKEDKEKIDKKEATTLHEEKSNLSQSTFFNFIAGSTKEFVVANDNKQITNDDNIDNKEEVVVSKNEVKVKKPTTVNNENISNTAKQHHKYDNFDEPRKLSDFYPISDNDREILVNKSGKDISLEFMNDILRSMAYKMEKSNKEPTFRHKGQFFKYLSIALKYEQRNEDKEIESYFCKVEDDAICKRTPFRQLKAKLVNTLPKDIAYPLVKNMIYTNLDYIDKSYATNTNSNCLDSIIGTPIPCTISVTRDIQISENYKQQILNDVKAVYGSNVSDITFRKKSDTQNQIYKQQELTQENAKQNENIEVKAMNTDVINCDIWTKIVNCLAKNHDVDASFIRSLINANIDESNKNIVVTTDTETSKELIETRYLDTLKEIIEHYGYKLLRFGTKHYESIPDGTWGDIRKYLINEYDENFDKSCFSKLTPSINETNKTITFKSDREQSVIAQRFRDVIVNACDNIGYQISYD